MKKILIATAFLLFLTSITPTVKAQEWNIGLDINSSYIWRGSKFGTGPAFQPTIEYNISGFTAGFWGNVNASENEAAETDIYIKYDFDFGLSFGITDYYYPGTEFFAYSEGNVTHAFEFNLGYEIGGFTLSGNYFFNQATAPGSALNAGCDMYFEAKYGFKHLDVFVGAGDGFHTPEHNFGLVNVGIGTSKKIKFTDSFSLPLSGSVVLNPTTEQLYIVVGINL